MSSSSCTDSEEQTSYDEDSEFSLSSEWTDGSEISLFSEATSDLSNSSEELRIEPVKYSEEEVKHIVHGMMSDEDSDDRRAASTAFRKMFNEKQTLSGIFGMFTPGASDDVRLEVVKLLSQLCARSQTVKEAKEKIRPFCADLLKSVQLETNESVKKELFKLIGEIVDRRKDSWPELQKFIQESFNSDDLASQKNTLEMMLCWSETGCCRMLIEWSCVEIFIVKSILGSDLILRKPAIQVFSTFLGDVPDETVKAVLSRVYKLAKEVSVRGCAKYSCGADDDGTKKRGIETECNGEHAVVLSCLSSMVHRIDDGIMSEYIEGMFSICTQTAMNRKVCDKCNHSIDLLVSLTANHADIIPSNLIPAIVHSCLLWVAEAARQHSTHWMAFNPVVSDSIYSDPSIMARTNYVRSILSRLGREKFGDHLIETSEKFQADENWANRAASLIIWIVLDAQWESVDGLQYLIDRATSALKDINSFVRKSAADLINIIGEYTKFKLEVICHNEMISSLISLAAESDARMKDCALLSLYSWISKGQREGHGVELLVSGRYPVLIPLLTKIVAECRSGDPKYFNALALVIIVLLGESMGRDRFKPYFGAIERTTNVLLTSMDRSHKEFESISEFYERICRIVEEGLLKRFLRFLRVIRE